VQEVRGEDRPELASILIASTRAEVQHSATPALPARATVTRTPAHTNQAPNDARGAREKAQRGTVGWGHLAPGCTVHRAATNGRTPRNCAVQPPMPYDSTTRSGEGPHTKSTVPETTQLHAEFGAGRVPERQSWYKTVASVLRMAD